ncbi:MAG: alpha-xylosidase, partial [Prevotella sp.]|nr:alpha-xylosidase [Prevotella sp.]
MTLTNYHLFDFMDFDAELSKNESLWKACKPVAVYECGNDVCIDVPFQKQMLSNDMAADESAARETYTLVLRQYTTKTLRLFMAFDGKAPE